MDSRGSQRTVLVVDDDARSRQLTVYGLASGEWWVFEASDGLEALEMVPRCRPDVIVLDIQMPGIDGLEVLRRLRKNPDASLAATWTIAATALAMPGDRERCLEAGANDYLSRPFSFRELRERIRQAPALRPDEPVGRLNG